MPSHPRRMAALLAALACWLAPTFAADSPEALIAKLVPSTGWSAAEPARVAEGDALFDLIDGGAELYHEFGFKRAASWQLDGASRASIQVEVYEMNDPAAAYGVLSLMQTGQFTPGPLGQGSLRFGYYVAFWSGSCFASVTGAQKTPAVQAEVDRLASQLAALLPRDGRLPDWFELAPANGLQTRKYFRGRIGLSNIATGGVADRFDIPEGLAVDYPGVQLIVLHYDTADAAAAELAKADTGTPNVAVHTKGRDLLVFSFTDDTRYRAIAETLGLGPP